MSDNRFYVYFTNNKVAARVQNIEVEAVHGRGYNRQAWKLQELAQEAHHEKKITDEELAELKALWRTADIEYSKANIEEQIADLTEAFVSVLNTLLYKCVEDDTRVRAESEPKIAAAIAKLEASRDAGA